MNLQNTRKQLSGTLTAVIRILQIILYVTIQMCFIPFAIIGTVVGVYKEMVKGKKLGVSFSAIKALQYRWFMHYFDTREDTQSVQFTKKFPCESHFGLWTIFGALIISQRLFGFTTRFGRLDSPGEETYIGTAAGRVLVFDRIMEKYVDKMVQIVLVGAGFDLVSLRFTQNKKVNVFELDQVKTLNVKTETLKKAGIKNDWITYVPIDYATESWTTKLLEAGFNPSKKTLFLWQSVSLYLDEDDVKGTLKDMANLCVDGSVIAQDFYSKAFSLGEYSKTVKNLKNAIEKRGEPWKFGIDMSNDPKAAIESFLDECGLVMTECTQFGEKLDLEPFYCIAEAKKIERDS